MAHAFFSFYWNYFILGLTTRFVLLAELAMIGGIVVARVGEGFGLPRLFWHEKKRKQFIAGVSVTLLVAKILYVSYLIEISVGSGGTGWNTFFPAGVALYSGKGIAVYILYGVASLVFSGALIWVFGTGLRLVSGHTHRRETSGPAWRPAIPLERCWPFALGIAAGVATVAVVLVLLQGVIALCASDGVVSRLALWVAPSWADEAAPMHLTAAIIFAALAIQYATLAVLDPEKWASPALGLCLVMGLVAAAYGATAAHMHHPTLVIVVFAALLVIGGVPRYKIRVSSFQGLYADGKAAEVYPVVAAVEHPGGNGIDPPPDCPETGHVLWRPPGHTPGQKYPLIFACVSGGGIRASVWSAAVLAELEKRIPDHFPHHIRLVTGASGGIVGASYYVNTLQEPRAADAYRPSHSVDLEKLVDDLAGDSLSPTAHHMFFRDLPLNFVPVNLGLDRGTVLDRTWIRNTCGRFDGSVASLAEGESKGWRPSLLITPMLVEDGRRLFITNLNLEHLTYGKGPRVCRNEPIEDAKQKFVGASPPAGSTSPNGSKAAPATDRHGGGADVFYSRSAYLCSKLFPEAWPKLKVVTAARLSASFPFVTPAPLLPTTPRRRVVDAGYFDNYGVSMAANWLEDTLNDPARLAWLKANVSKVLIVQIRDGVNALSKESPLLGDDPPTSAPTRCHEEFTSPLTAMLAARESVAMFRNDEKLEWLVKLAASRGFDETTFSTAVFQFTREASLSWYLPKTECDAIKGEVAAGSVQDAIGRVKGWLG